MAVPKASVLMSGRKKRPFRPGCEKFERDRKAPGAIYAGGAVVDLRDGSNVDYPIPGGGASFTLCPDGSVQREPDAERRVEHRKRRPALCAGPRRPAEVNGVAADAVRRCRRPCRHAGARQRHAAMLDGELVGSSARWSKAAARWCWTPTAIS